MIAILYLYFATARLIAPQIAIYRAQIEQILALQVTTIRKRMVYGKIYSNLHTLLLHYAQVRPESRVELECTCP